MNLNELSPHEITSLIPPTLNLSLITTSKTGLIYLGKEAIKLLISEWKEELALCSHDENRSVQIESKISCLNQAEYHASYKPLLFVLRPVNWFKEHDEVVVYVRGNTDFLGGSKFIRARVLVAKFDAEANMQVVIKYDEAQLEVRPFMFNRGDMYSPNSPCLMHIREYAYLISPEGAGLATIWVDIAEQLYPKKIKARQMLDDLSSEAVKFCQSDDYQPRRLHLVINDNGKPILSFFHSLPLVEKQNQVCTA